MPRDGGGEGGRGRGGGGVPSEEWEAEVRGAEAAYAHEAAPDNGLSALDDAWAQVAAKSGFGSVEEERAWKWRVTALEKLLASSAVAEGGARPAPSLPGPGTLEGFGFAMDACDVVG